MPTGYPERRTFPDAFFSRIGEKARNGCILWNGRFDHDGYGVMPNPERPPSDIRAHRAAYIVCVGQIPKGQHVLHTCDNRSCVNPGHLFLGTNLDNIADKVSKNRQRTPCGESSHLSRLRETDVKEIREHAKCNDQSARELAEAFGVSVRCIEQIISRKRWKHI